MGLYPLRMTNARQEHLLKSAEETAAFAQALSDRLSPGDTILLEGGVGAGKTHFARSLIQCVLDVPEDVPSPTFTLVQTYDGPNCEIWHSDLYRLTGPDEIVELGLIEAFEDAICLVEWPDRLAELIPQNALTISLSMTAQEGQRQLSLYWTDPKWDAHLKGLPIE